MVFEHNFSNIPTLLASGLRPSVKRIAFAGLVLLAGCSQATQTLSPQFRKQALPAQNYLLPNFEAQKLGRTVALPNRPIPDFGSIPAPADNPVTQGKVELGFRLWFEPKLSANNKMSCATCHNHTSGFSNAQANAVGVTGQRGQRNVPTTYGSVYLHEAFWDGRARNLEQQSLMPIQDPIEMNETLERVVAKLGQIDYYQHKFKEVYGTGVTPDGMAKALASFQRTLTLEPTPFERYEQGDINAMTPLEIKGMNVFFEGARCGMCHRGSALSDQQFVNIGIGMDRPNPDLGRFNVTQMEWDKGAFKTPTLLNIAKTAPYMHDGSMSTLDQVIDYYERGGNANPQLDPRVSGLHISPADKQALKAFMRNGLSANDNLKAIGRLPGIHLPAAEIERLISGAGTN